MKIYALTEMTDLPTGCRECPKCRFSGGEFAINNFWCDINGKTVIMFNRPDWCPLRTEQEIKESE